MKKNVLFIMNNLGCGGAEKALISLLQTIDYSKFNVDLYLFKHEGMFFSKIPKQVNILQAPITYEYFDMPIGKALIDNVRKGNFKIGLARLAAGIIFKTEKNRARCEQRVWRYLSAALAPEKNEYDAAIGFLEKNPIYFCVEKVHAHKKIGFIHTNYTEMGMDAAIDKKFFTQLDHILTVSQECASVLKKTFPLIENKVDVMQNIVSPEVIKKMSCEEAEFYKGSSEDIKIVSMGRLHFQKGFDLAIAACKALVEMNHKVKWYVIGEGEERKSLEILIKQHQLQDHFILLGQKENPYPYLRGADIYVHTSRVEGKSIAIDEVKILNRPIVVTNFKTVKDQIIHNKNGIIVAMDPGSIAKAVNQLLRDNPLRKQLIDNLSKEKLGSESEIIKLYKLIKAG